MKQSAIALGSLIATPISAFVFHMNPMPGLIATLVVIAVWPLVFKAEA